MESKKGKNIMETKNWWDGWTEAEIDGLKRIQKPLCFSFLIDQDKLKKIPHEHLEFLDGDGKWKTCLPHSRFWSGMVYRLNPNWQKPEPKKEGHEDLPLSLKDMIKLRKETIELLKIRSEVSVEHLIKLNEFLYRDSRYSSDTKEQEHRAVSVYNAVLKTTTGTDIFGAVHELVRVYCQLAFRYKDL